MTALRAVRLISAMPWGCFHLPTRLRSLIFLMLAKINAYICNVKIIERLKDVAETSGIFLCPKEI